MASQDRTAIVTGGAKRVGAAIVRALLDDGWTVIAHVHHDDDAVPEGAVRPWPTWPKPIARPDFRRCRGLPPVRLLVNNAARFAFDGFGDATRTNSTRIWRSIRARRCC